MPFRKRFRQRSGLGSVINSTKNIVDQISNNAGGVNSVENIAIAQNTPDNTLSDEVSIGCKIFRIYFELSINGTVASGVNNAVRFYIIKNPGNNLTNPNPGTTGASNEKKFIIYESMFNLGSSASGQNTANIKRWIKIPRVYHRMGTDDRWQFLLRNEAGTSSNFCTKFIYKWYR